MARMFGFNFFHIFTDPCPTRYGSDHEHAGRPPPAVRSLSYSCPCPRHVDSGRTRPPLLCLQRGIQLLETETPLSLLWSHLLRRLFQRPRTYSVLLLCRPGRGRASGTTKTRLHRLRTSIATQQSGRVVGACPRRDAGDYGTIDVVAAVEQALERGCQYHDRSIPWSTVSLCWPTVFVDVV